MQTNASNETLKVTGVTELTALSAREVKENITAAFSPELVNLDFDASQMEFLDSSGLGTLISLQKLAALRNGSFRLISPTPSAIQILELTRLHRVFQIVS